MKLIYSIKSTNCITKEWNKHIRKIFTRLCFSVNEKSFWL